MSRGKRVNMDVIQAWTEGLPCSEQELLEAVNDICDAVAHKFYRHRLHDDEMFGVARCRIFELLCEDRLDFSRGKSRCFSFLYTTARNMMANYLKKTDRRESCEMGSETIHLTRGPFSDYAGVPVWKTDAMTAAKTAMDRVSSLGLGRSYERLCWKAGLFRAFSGQPA